MTEHVKHSTDYVALTEAEQDAIWTAATEHAWRGVTTSPSALYAVVRQIIAARVADAKAEALEEAASEWLNAPESSSWINPDRWLRERARRFRPATERDDV